MSWKPKCAFRTDPGERICIRTNYSDRSSRALYVIRLNVSRLAVRPHMQSDCNCEMALVYIVKYTCTPNVFHISFFPLLHTTSGLMVIY